MTTAKSRDTLATRRRADQNKAGETIRSERGRINIDLSEGNPGDILIINADGTGIDFVSVQEIQDLVKQQTESLAVLVKILAEVHDLEEECIREEVQINDGD